MSFRELHETWNRAFLPPLEMPERFAQARPHGLPVGEVRTCVEQYLDHFWAAADRGIAPCLTGRAGQWKTYGAAVIARFADWMLVPTAFIACGDYFSRADALFFETKGQQLVDRVQSVAFAVFDDFTQVKPDSRAAELLANVVAERFARKLPTVFTANMPIGTTEELKAVAGMYRADFARRVWHGSDGYRVTIR